MSKNPFDIRGKTSLKAIEPAAEEPSENFGEEQLVGMTFNMPKSWHKSFKQRSLDEDISMKDLLIRCYDVYRAQTKRGSE